MDKDTFEKIQELYSSIVALHPLIAADNEKEYRLYMALHDINKMMKEKGCKQFEITNK
jgi:cell fate (sporulation/competence/biofilm development) regulator YlbF (YheA/YmcA/DUF963 family)